MQDYQFRDPVVIVKCQAYTGAVAATVRDKGVCEASGGGVRGGVSRGGVSRGGISRKGSQHTTPHHHQQVLFTVFHLLSNLQQSNYSGVSL